MLVYGDHSERACPADHLARIADRLAEAAAGGGIHRHSALVHALVETGRLLQGTADADLTAPDLAPFLHALAQAVCRSWDQHFTGPLAIPQPPSLPELPQVDLRLPEGYAFYAVYPEAYADAARRLTLAGEPRVIGIRSIGTSLAAIVAAALDAPPAINVRPAGHPFARHIAVAPELERALLGGDPHFVIVDEGPGLSGSSFGAVVDWLSARSVSLDRIAILPSHAGSPGSEASERIRTRWPLLQREVADLGRDLPDLLHAWAEQALGPFDGPLQEISGGEWRRHLAVSEWPAVNPMWERRKFLAQTPHGQTILLKFAGLGNPGTARLALARTLHAAGLVPEPLALVHGFLAERWHADARPLRPADDPPLGEIAHYIGTRARLLPAASDSGASLTELLTMARRNIALELGNQAAAALDGWEPRLPMLERRVRRTVTDNRLAPHEWLRVDDRRLLKADALDHHAGHDLIGCQDPAWDVAGAILEFDLDELASAALASATGVPIDPDLLAFYRIAYAAFRLGQARLSLAMVADPAERERLQAQGDRFAAHATRQQSLLDGDPERTAPGTKLDEDRLKKKM